MITVGLVLEFLKTVKVTFHLQRDILTSYTFTYLPVVEKKNRKQLEMY